MTIKDGMESDCDDEDGEPIRRFTPATPLHVVRPPLDDLNDDVQDAFSQTVHSDLNHYHKANDLINCLAEDYLRPEVLHDIKQRDSVSANDNPDDIDDGQSNLTSTIGSEVGESAFATTKEREFVVENVGGDSANSEHGRTPRKKTISKAKSTSRKKKATSPLRPIQPLTGRLLQASEERLALAMTHGDALRASGRFHCCVCARPSKCPSCSITSSVSPVVNGSVSDLRGTAKTTSSTRSDKDIVGWYAVASKRSERQTSSGMDGRNASSTSSSSSNLKKRKPTDAPLTYRSSGDSARYIFKHYGDWQTYAEEYRKYYTVSNSWSGSGSVSGMTAGTGTNSFYVADGADNREAVAIVRSLSDSVRQKLNEVEEEVPDWNDFTDINSTPMQPLNLIPTYKSGKFPDMGITWSAGAARRDASLDPAYSVSRHVKVISGGQQEPMATVGNTITTRDDPRATQGDIAATHGNSTTTHGETMATQGKNLATQGKQRKKRILVNLASHESRQPTWLKAIPPHNAGINIPAESLHTAEDFRKHGREKSYGADVHPIGYRFVTNWKPHESLHSRSWEPKNADHTRSGPVAETPAGGDGSDGKHHRHRDRRKHTRHIDEQTRSGLLKLLMPPTGNETIRFLSENTDVKKVKQKSRTHGNQSDRVDEADGRTQRLSNEHGIKAKSAVKRVDLSTWSSLMSNKDEHKAKNSGAESSTKNDGGKHSASKIKVDNQSEDSSRSESRSRSSGIRPRKALSMASITSKRRENSGEGRSTSSSPRDNFLLIKGERSKEDRANAEGDADHTANDTSVENSPSSKKTKLKFSARFAKPLEQDTVLLGSHYGTVPCLGNEGLNVSV